MKKTILIGTTGVNRSLLHNNVIPDWYKYINNIDKNKYNIHWFINVDYIEKLNETVDKTKKNLQTIIKDIPITFIKKKDENTGNFLEACQNVSSNIEQYVINNKLNPDDVIIFWLEDDWKLSSKNIPLQELIENYLSNLTHINLSYIRNNYIHALAPSILSYNLWSQLHLEAWKNQKEYIDPESCVGLFFFEKYKYKHYEDLMNITVINKYKKLDENALNKKCLEQKNSYYSYDVILNNDVYKNDKYIKKSNIKEFINNKITFIRITNSLCSDYGREFLKNMNLTQIK